MARILELCDGAEWGDTGWWSSIVDSAYFTVSSAKKYTGTYSYKFWNLTASATKIFPTGLSEFYFRTYFNWSKYGTGSSVGGVYFRSDTNVVANILVHDTSHLITAVLNGVSMSVSTQYIDVNTWYRLEAHLKIDNTVGVYEIRVNNVSILSYSGDTLGSYSTVNNLYLFPCYANSLDNCYDDIGFDDSEWLGDGGYILLRPDGNGDYTNWDGSDGDSTDNYALVDETPPNTTDYVYTTADSEKESYALGTYTIPTGKFVKRFWAAARAKSPDSAVLKLGVRSNTTDSLCSSNRTLTSAYADVVGDELTTDPDTSTTITQSGLDSLEVLMDSSS